MTDQTTPSHRAGLRNEIARAIHRYDHEHGLSGNDIPGRHHRGEADAVLAALYRKWPWLRAEAEDHPTDPEPQRQLAAAIKSLGTSETENANLREQLARVRALADRWDNALAPDRAYARALHAALDEPASGQAAADTCRPVNVGGETIRVRGSGEFTERDQEFAAEILRAAKRKYAAEHCGHVAPTTLLTTTRTECALPPGHEDHTDERGRRWQTAPGADTTRVINLYERWIKAGAPPLGTLMSRWWDARLAELRDAIFEPTEQQDGHVYLSTGCYHGDHAYCQNMTGLAGAKRPGECKHCGTRCICGCHTGQTKEH